MKTTAVGRREFLAGLAGSAALLGNSRGVWQPAPGPPRIRFSVIGLNHGHINGMTDAVIRGGGELVAVYAKEPDLSAAFVKKYPQAKPAGSEKAILESNVQLVLSAAIPDERAPLGIRVMQHGKDYLSDKPGITSLEQLAEVRRVQTATRRIYSI
jgi:predicted dehydrogenase